MDPLKVLSFRGFFYIFLVFFTGIFSHIVFVEEVYVGLERYLLAVVIATLGQSIVTVLSPKRKPGLFILFLGDAALVMLLTRATGSSTSPFVLLFPCIALAGAVIFERRLAILLVGLTTLFMTLAVGFKVAVIGNGVAIIVTGYLGLYLSGALFKSDKALRVSEILRRRLESLQKSILTNIPSGLMSVNLEGIVIQMNSVGLKILAQDENQVLGSHIEKVFPNLEKKIESAINSPEEKTRPVLSYTRSDGVKLELGYSLANLSDPETKEKLGTLIVFQDLTRVTRLEEELRRSEKLAAVGKLAASIAHEIRNPLAGISGSAQLLGGLKNLNAEDEKLLKIIQRESQRLDSLISEFLEYVRPQKVDVQKIDLHQVSLEVIESLKVNPKWKELRCEVSLKGEKLYAKADAKKLTQVLMNILLNAGQAHATKVEIKLAQNIHTSAIEISDNGDGIAAEDLKLLFEPFFTTKENGTGLGLAISYRALEAMGARIEAISPHTRFANKGGTMFRISFEGART